jgi:hypothetical protein
MNFDIHSEQTRFYLQQTAYEEKLFQDFGRFDQELADFVAIAQFTQQKPNK